MQSSTPKVLDKYFGHFHETMTKNDLLNKPGQIFNYDESGFSLNPKPGYIATRKGQPHNYSVTSGRKTQITVMACICAAGYSMPPRVIFDRKGLNPDWTEEVPGTRYGLNQLFLKFIPAARPILLLLDGHSFHYNPAVIKQIKNIIIFCLPPNTTHLMQPLDRVCFGTVKQFWNEECHSYMQKHPGKVIRRGQFCQVFRLTWMRRMIMKNIFASFKTTGIQPFNKLAIALPGECNTTSDEKQSTERKPVRYLPFFAENPMTDQGNVSSHSQVDPHTT